MTGGVALWPAVFRRRARIAIVVALGLALSGSAAARADVLSASVSGTPTGQSMGPGFLGVSFEYRALHQYTGRDPRAANLRSSQPVRGNHHECPIRAWHHAGPDIAIIGTWCRFSDETCGHMTTGSDFPAVFDRARRESLNGWSFQDNGTVPGVQFCNTLMNRPQRRMTVKKLMMVAALVAYASPALAGSYVSTWGCKFSRFYGYSNCRSTWTEIPDPVRDLEQERLDAIARQQEDAKWEAFLGSLLAAQQNVRRAA